MRKRANRLAPLGLLILGATQGHADLQCNYVTATGCLVCFGTQGGACCGYTQCGTNPIQGGCGSCHVASADKAQPKALLAKLLSQDPAVKTAIKCLR